MCAHNHVYVFIHVLLKINILGHINTNFFLLLFHTGRYLCLKVRPLEDIMLTIGEETAEVAELS